MSKNSKIYLLVGILFILGLLIGFFVGKSADSKRFSKPPLNSKGPAPKNLFDTQTASIRGQILAINNRNLTVKNLNKNTTGELPASDRVMVIKLGQNARTAASPSADLSSVTLEKEVLISLEMVNGEYQVTVVQEIIPAPSLPPIPQVTPLASPTTKTTTSTPSTTNP